MGSSKHPFQMILDIGTHKVLGLATHPRDDYVEVVASHMVRHPQRAMRDGQVHDVPAVSRTLQHVKKHLEAALDTSFSQAHIAAAGRALKTRLGRAEQHFEKPTVFTDDMRRHLEWEAVAQAQASLLESAGEEMQSQGYYCIAHANRGYWLEDDPIGSIVGQRGRSFAVEVLATFLPGIVVDSLEAVLTHAGLEMVSMTLEPIAALHAIIPESMRHLRLLLVDVGAGTSDIALTGDGTVQAFGMVPRAGDAFTDEIASTLLLDFHVAEKAKRNVSAGNTVTVENVLGESVELSPEMLQEIIQPTVDELARHIAEEMSRWTERPPDAVLLVGGGSETLGLKEALARELDVASNRVAVRDRRGVRAIQGAEELQGPDAVTAFGIAIRASYGREMAPVRVRVNDQPTCLFLPDRQTVREAVRIAGVPPHQLMGRMGKGITVTVNGEVMIFPGTRGKEARLYVNGVPATLDQQLENLDEVIFEKPVPGQAPKVQVRDVLKRWQNNQPAAVQPFSVWIQGVRKEVGPIITRNHRPAGLDEVIEDRDELLIGPPTTFSDFMTALAEPVPVYSLRCYVNDRPVSVEREGLLFRNGEPAALSDPVAPEDRWEWQAPEPLTVKELLEKLDVPTGREFSVSINGEAKTLTLPLDLRVNNAPASMEQRLFDGDRIQFTSGTHLTLYQLLPYVGISPEGAGGKGRRLVLEVGGRPAQFTTPISPGDDVVVKYVS